MAHDVTALLASHARHARGAAFDDGCTFHGNWSLRRAAVAEFGELQLVLQKFALIALQATRERAWSDLAFAAHRYGSVAHWCVPR